LREKSTIIILALIEQVRDVTIGEGESVQPDTLFVKTWKVQNTGNDPWPPGCVLVHTHGHLMTSAGQTCLAVDPPLLPAQTRDLSIEMRSPVEAGIYEGKWRLSTAGGQYFGDAIWVILTVERAGTLGLTQQLSNFAVGSATAAGSTPAVAAAPQTHFNPFSPRKMSAGDAASPSRPPNDDEDMT